MSLLCVWSFAGLCISGYMSACWRELAKCRDVSPFVIAFQTMNDEAVAFSDHVMRHVPCQLLNDVERNDPAAIASIIEKQKPDVLVIPGWAHKAYCRLTTHPMLARVPVVMAMDTPWRNDWRQRLAKWRLRRLLQRVDRVMVTGERCWQYARRLGFTERQIHRGVYGIDYQRLHSCHAQRLAQSNGWPLRMLYVGRYESEKGMDLLLAAHAQYRKEHAQPMPLSCCGMGSMKAKVQAAEHVDDLGFVQPDALANVMIEHGLFILASRYDPWPLVIAEACAAGLPVICTEACGSAVELVRSYHNGLVVPTDDADALAQAMSWMHAHCAELPIMGQHGQAMAAAYSSERWATRWCALLCQLKLECTNR